METGQELLEGEVLNCATSLVLHGCDAFVCVHGPNHCFDRPHTCRLHNAVMINNTCIQVYPQCQTSSQERLLGTGGWIVANFVLC